MLLQRLVEYSDRIPFTPVMYLQTPIKWLIQLDKHGKFLEIIKTTDDSGRHNDRGKKFLSPHIGRASGIKAKLLADNGEYVLGLPRDSSDPERVKECHQAFKELVAIAAEKTGEPTLKAVCAFYVHNKTNKIELPATFDPADILSFRVDSGIPFELASVQRFWAKFTGVVADEADGEEQIDIYPCIVCGASKPAVRRLPFKIKRIPNGQTAGNALISANSPAFESYGLEESLISPICAEDAEKFSKAANALLEGEDTHLTIGPLAYIFWTKEENSFSFATLLSKPDAAQVHQLIESAFSGKKAALGIDASPFYAAALSASGARVAIRDWLETTVANVKQNLARYFRLQRIAELDGSEPQPMGINALSAATVPLKQNKPDYAKISPNVPKVLLKCAIEGTPLPEWLLYQAVKRTKAEQGVRKGHAALIKMVIASQDINFDEEENRMEEIDKSNKEPAYLCGQLLGVLESVQYAAMGKTSSTVIGRFYGTASSAPASVFGTLLRGAQAHLDKLRKNREGAYVALQRKLEEVQSDLRIFPKTLTLQQQGLFALGYYHQRAKDAKDRAEAKAKKQANNTNISDSNE